MIGLIRTCLLAASTLLFSTPAAVAAPEYNFVRIQGLAEQAVGERLLMEVYDRAGIEISITPMPGSRALQEAASGRMDGETLRVFALGENEPRLIRVPTPLSDLQTSVFVPKSSRIQINDASELNDHTSVVVIGVLHTKAITAGVRNVTEVPDPATMFRMVQSGRVEMALTSALDGQAKLAEEGITDLVALEPALKTLELYHYVHEDHADLVPIIDAVVQEMKASGELQELRAQFEADLLAELGVWVRLCYSSLTSLTS